MMAATHLTTHIIMSSPPPACVPVIEKNHCRPASASRIAGGCVAGRRNGWSAGRCGKKHCVPQFVLLCGMRSSSVSPLCLQGIGVTKISSITYRPPSRRRGNHCSNSVACAGREKAKPWMGCSGGGGGGGGARLRRAEVVGVVHDDIDLSLGQRRAGAADLAQIAKVRGVTKLTRLRATRGPPRQTRRRQTRRPVGRAAHLGGISAGSRRARRQ